MEDPTWKVLPAALRKYKINNDDWQNYAMFICYGPPSKWLSFLRTSPPVTMLFPGNRIERCLSYDESPLLLFQRLKDASKNPVFMLKHIKDIRSPIAIAQQKQAARKAFGDSSSSIPEPASHARTPSGQESSNNFQSFKVSLEDPTWKVLPAALRKYKIATDDWQNYVMFICYGPPSKLLLS